jgi:hypothetical protein
MKNLYRMTRNATLGLAFVGLTAFTMTAQTQQAQQPAQQQQPQDDPNSRDRAKSETTMTGCLNKAESGSFVLTDEKTGVKTTVTGPSDLEKHSGNNKVTLTGTAKADANGNQIFEVTKIHHVADSCKAGPAQ